MPPPPKLKLARWPLQFGILIIIIVNGIVNGNKKIEC